MGASEVKTGGGACGWPDGWAKDEAEDAAAKSTAAAVRRGMARRVTVCGPLIASPDSVKRCKANSLRDARADWVAGRASPSGERYFPSAAEAARIFLWAGSTG